MNFWKLFSHQKFCSQNDLQHEKSKTFFFGNFFKYVPWWLIQCQGARVFVFSTESEGLGPWCTRPSAFSKHFFFFSESFTSSSCFSRSSLLGSSLNMQMSFNFRLHSFFMSQNDWFLSWPTLHAWWQVYRRMESLHLWLFANKLFRGHMWKW